MVNLHAIRFIAAGALTAVLLQSVSLFPFSNRGLDTFELISPASAKERIRYKPPSLPGPLRTAGTGSRGCDNTPAPVSLVPLVPEQHIGQTTSEHPAFLGYVSGAKAIAFTLVEPNVEKPIVEQVVPVSNSGIVRIKLPKDSPKLTPGKKYRWTLAIVCNPKRRSQDIAYTQAFIQRIAPTPTLEKQLAEAKSAQMRAQIYATAGIWYDAIDVLSNASAADPTNQSLSEDLLSLLEQVGLATVAAKEQKINWVATPKEAK